MTSSRPSATPRVARWIATAALAVVGCSGPSETAEVYGLRLGYTPAQCRERFTLDSGEFTYVAGPQDDSMRWTPPPEDRAEVLSAVLEFHLGLLVAVRLELAPTSPLAAGDALEVRDGSILTREERDDRVTMTWLSRGCPTHADEVRRRLSGLSR